MIIKLVRNSITLSCLISNKEKAIINKDMKKQIKIFTTLGKKNCIQNLKERTIIKIPKINTIQELSQKINNFLYMYLKKQQN